MMLELYKKNHLFLSYRNHTYLAEFRHLLQIKDLSNDEIRLLWVDPSAIDDPRILKKIENLSALKNKITEEEYNHAVACFIELLISKATYACLGFSSLAKEILQHHQEPEKLYSTLQHLDLKPEPNPDLAETMNSFVMTLKTYASGLRGTLITPHDAEVSRTSLLRNFSAFPIQQASSNEATSTLTSLAPT